MRTARDPRAAGPIAGNALGHLLRYLASVLAAEALTCGDDALRALIRDHFAHARSHGQHLGLARRLAGAIAAEGPEHPAGRIAALLGDRAAAAGLDAAVALRNRVLKKGDVDAGDELKRAVVELAGAAVFLREFPLVRVVSARQRAGAHVMEIDFLTGHGEAGAAGRVESDLALHPDRVYVLDPVSRSAVDLHPLYVCEPDGRLTWLSRTTRAPEYERGDGDVVRRPDLAAEVAAALETDRREPLRARFLALRGDARDPGQRRLAPGDLVDGRYRVVELIAEGGMAQVYEVVDGDGAGEPRRALKLLPYEYIRDRSMLVRFRREATHTAGFQHPHVMPCLHCGEETGDHYLVMPLAAGWDGRRDLSQLPLPLPIEDAVRIGRQIADGLSYVHARGVVHRDLKPRNVLLDGTGTVKLTDFGVARTGDAMALTMTGVSLGTPEYVAPEQVEHGGERLGPAADVYSFGAVLFELLTGAPPFTGASPLAVIHAAATRPVPNPRRLRPEIPGELAALVKECLSRDPDARPSARELFARLAPFAGAEAGNDAASTHAGGTRRDDAAPKPRPLAGEGQGGGAREARDEPDDVPIAQPPRGLGWGRAAAISAVLLAVAAAAVYLMRSRPTPAAAAVTVSGDIVVTASVPRPEADIELPRAKWMPAQLAADGAAFLSGGGDSLSMMYLSGSGASLSGSSARDRLTGLWKNKRNNTWKLDSLLAERQADEDRLRRRYRGFEDDPAQRLRLDRALDELRARTQPRIDEVIETDRGLRRRLILELEAQELDLTDAGLFLLAELLYERAQDETEDDRDVEPSIAAVDRLLERFPDSDVRAPAMYLRAYAMQERAATDEERDTAAAAFLHLAYQYPEAEVTQQAYVRAAEHYFASAGDADDLRKAQRAYRWLVDSDAPAAAALRRPTRFKLGWTELRLGEVDAAADDFCKALAPAPPDGPAPDLALEDAAEAGLAFALALREIEPARIEMGCRDSDCTCRPGVVADLAGYHAAHNRSTAAESLYRTWLASFPDHPDAPATHCRLAQLLEERGLLDQAAMERDEMAARYAPGSTWAAANVRSLGKADVVGLTECPHAHHIPATGEVTPAAPGDAARTAVEMWLPALAHCYRRTLLAHPDAAGRLPLTFELEEVGSVISATPGAADLPPELVECAVGIASEIHFDGVHESTLTLALRFDPAP